MPEGVSLVRKGLFGFHVELGVAFKYVADTFHEHEKCNLKVLDYYNQKGIWFAIRRNHTLRRMITVGMFRIREHGIQARENQLLYAPKPRCNDARGSFLSIGMVDVSPAFLFLLWGFLAAVLVLVAEVVYHKFTK